MTTNMKLSRFLVLLALTLVTIPALAQRRLIDISAFATWVDPSGKIDLSDLSTPQEIDFDPGQGWGAAVNVFWSNRISTEFSASIVEPDLNVGAGDPLVFSQGLEMMPIAAVLQLHPLSNMGIDPYVGVGVAYFLFDNLERGNLGNIEFEEIDFQDDFGVVANVGVSWSLTRALRLYLDGKYVPLNSAARAVFADGPGEEQEVEINPLMLSAGLTFRF